MRPGRSLLLIGLGAPVVAMTGARLWWHRLARGRTYPLAEVPSRPAALVLGAQVYPGGTPSPFLAARLDLAQQLYDAGRVERLLLSGDGAAPEYDEPAAMRAYLRQRGVPEAAISCDPQGVETYASCRRARDVFGLRGVVIATQSYHLDRAVGTAVALGLDAVGVGDRSVAGHRSWRKGVLRELPAAVKAVLDVGARPPRCRSDRYG